MRKPGPCFGVPTLLLLLAVYGAQILPKLNDDKSKLEVHCFENPQEYGSTWRKADQNIQMDKISSLVKHLTRQTLFQLWDSN